MTSEQAELAVSLIDGLIKTRILIREERTYEWQDDMAELLRWENYYKANLKNLLIANQCEGLGEIKL